eukprot:2696935-Prymnesium_polylepis.2
MMIQVSRPSSRPPRFWRFGGCCCCFTKVNKTKNGARAVQAPSHACVYYKAVAVVDGSLLSIFDGETVYECGVHMQRGTGIFVCAELLSVVRHTRQRLPRRNALLDAPRVILRLLGWNWDGTVPAGEPGSEKLAVTDVIPIAVLPYSAADGGVPDTIRTQRATVVGALPGSEGQRPRTAESRLSPGAAWQLYGGGEPQSERMQAATVRLEEDVVDATERLQQIVSDQQRFVARQAPSGWMQRAFQAAGIAVLWCLEDIVDADHLRGRQIESRYAVVVQPFVAQNSAQQILGTVHVRWIDLHAQVHAVEQAGRRKDRIDPAGPVAAHLMTHELQELEHAVSAGRRLHVRLRHFCRISKFVGGRLIAASKEVVVLVVLQVAAPLGGSGAVIHS